MKFSDRDAMTVNRLSQNRHSRSQSIVAKDGYRIPLVPDPVKLC
jgi:hypothetical protein